MPIALGIPCEQCGTVYLVSALVERRHIDSMPRSAGAGMFTLKCGACPAVRSFHKNDLRPYVVSAEIYANGYAARGEYSLAPSSRSA
jgi:hypothetical protein